MRTEGEQGLSGIHSLMGTLARAGAAPGEEGSP